MNHSRSRSRSRSASILSALKKPLDKQYLSTSTQLQDYEIISNIGIIDDISHGYFSKYLPTNSYVTMKQTDLSMSTDYELILEMIDTVKNSKVLRHENILTTYASFVHEENLWIVTEPVRIGSCKKLILENFPEGIKNENVVATILKEVLKALIYLHENNCIHNNIRADNILLDSNGEVRISGMHQIIHCISDGVLKQSCFKFVGDPEWMAPEVISQATTFNEKIDIYSLGITALELFYGKSPFDQWPALKILLCKLHYEVPTMLSSNSKNTSKAFSKFIERCLHKNPLLRPSAFELMEDPFIKQARNFHYIENHLLKKRVDSGMSISSDGLDSPTSPRSRPVSVVLDLKPDLKLNNLNLQEEP